MGWIVSFLRYAALRLSWTLRGPGRHHGIKKYRGGLKALMALNAHTSPRADGGDLTSIVRLTRTLPPTLQGLNEHTVHSAHTPPRAAAPTGH